MADGSLLQLVPSAAQTASGTGAAFDAERPGRSVTAVVTVTAASGIAPTLVVTIEQSDTGLDGEWETADQFPMLTGTTALNRSWGSSRRYLRARWDIAGTTPSFTFDVKARAYSHLITRQQFCDRIGADMVKLAFDDGNVGTASESAIDRLLADVSSLLRGKLGQVDDLSGLGPDQASEAVRIGLDVAHAMAACRRPEVFRLDGQKMMEMVRRDLKEIVSANATMGTPAAPSAPARPPVTSFEAGVASYPSRDRRFGRCLD